MEYTGDVIMLSLFQRADAAVLLEADADPEHRHRFDFPPDFRPSLQHSEDVIARWEAERLARKRFPYAVRDAATGELLGGVELLPLGDNVANLSYWTHPRYRRRGVAGRAVMLVCRLAFGEFGFRALQILVDTDNVASRRTAVGNGFREVGAQDARVCYVLESTEQPPVPTPLLAQVPPY
jgi:RimJ/RimL family protein N-acetyltransferase